jgi:hypothetical protein
MGLMAPKSKLLPSAYHMNAANAINAADETLHLLHFERGVLNAGMTAHLLTDNSSQ